MSNITATNSTNTATGTEYCMDWYHSILFLILTIGAFVITVPTVPGSNSLLKTEIKICSLFSPFYGVGRAASLIQQGSVLTTTPLQRAARAGALCVVTRNKAWKGERGEFPLRDENERTAWNGSSFIDPEKFEIQGQAWLPEGYCIALLDRLEEVEPLAPEEDNPPSHPLHLSSNYSVSSIFAGLSQITSSVATLMYNTAQISRGRNLIALTVIPYALMSFMNLFGALFNRDYPCMFMVESDIMKEAVAEGAFIAGTVGRVKPVLDSEIDDENSTVRLAPFKGSSHTNDGENLENQIRRKYIHSATVNSRTFIRGDSNHSYASSHNRSVYHNQPLRNLRYII